MSAFLGPIHHWLYRKIQLQEELTEALLTGQEQLNQKLDASCGAAERRPLAEVIDTDNIHGWLQEQVSVVEGRFAAAVTELLIGKYKDMESLKQTAHAFGREHAVVAADAPEAFQSLSDLLLDGMPCDHVNEVLEQTDHRVAWRQKVDLHQKFWQNVGGDAANYYALREAMISGMLQDCGFAFSQNGDEFSIERR
ncbi:MAG: hypothetical protein ACLT3H_11510 [Roseburia sp.]